MIPDNHSGGSRKEFYKIFNIEGEPPEDQEILISNKHLHVTKQIISQGLEEKIKTHINNKEAMIRSRYEGVVGIWNKCLGIQNIN